MSGMPVGGPVRASVAAWYLERAARCIRRRMRSGRTEDLPTDAEIDAWFEQGRKLFLQARGDTTRPDPLGQEQGGAP